MKLVFASDSFKGSLSSVRTAELLTKAAHEVFGDCTCIGVPMADGGEGTVDAVITALNGKKVIDTWPDADGGSHYASHSTRAPSWRADPANRKPFISSGWASNNLNVVDFGYPQNPSLEFPMQY